MQDIIPSQERMGVLNELNTPNPTPPTSRRTKRGEEINGTTPAQPKEGWLSHTAKDAD